MVLIFFLVGTKLRFVANWNKAHTALLTNEPEIELTQSGFSSLLPSFNWLVDDCKSVGSLSEVTKRCCAVVFERLKT